MEATNIVNDRLSVERPMRLVGEHRGTATESNVENEASWFGSASRVRSAAAEIIQDWGFIPYLRVSVTGACNAHCNFCHNEGNGRHSATIKPHGYEPIARAGFDLGIRSAKFTGGEPTLRKDLERIVSVFKAAGYTDLSLITNGVYLTPARQLSLREAGLSRVSVSLHSLVPDTYNKLFRGETHALTTVLENLKDISARFPGAVKLNVVFNPGTNFPHEVIPLAEYAAKIGAVLSVLSILGRQDGDGDDALISTRVFQLIAEKYAVAHVTTAIKRTVKTKTIHFSNGTVLELDDFRLADSAMTKDNNTYCVCCPVREQCVEGPYAFRVKADGTFKPCLIRQDNEIPYAIHRWAA